MYAVRMLVCMCTSRDPFTRSSHKGLYVLARRKADSLSGAFLQKSIET